MAAPHTILVELFMDGAWVDITADVRVDPPLSITFGVRGEAGLVDPSEARLTVNNTTGKYTPKNAVGPYYGLLKRNTPLRVTVGGVVRYVGEVSEFPSRWDPSGADVYEPLIASGTLRRLLRAETLQSTLSSYYVSNPLAIGYWPVTDEEGSESIASGLPGGPAMTITGSPDLAAFDPGPASEPIATWAASSALAGTGDVTGSTGFTAAFYLSIPTTETANGANLWQGYGDASGAGVVYRWWLEYRTGGFLRLRGSNILGAIIADSGDLNHLMIGATRLIVIECEDDGANLDWYVSSDIGTNLGTFAAVQTSAPSAVIIGSAELTGDVAIGQLAMAKVPFAFYTSDFNDVKSAYAGEPVEDRVDRIADEGGFDMTVVDDGTVSTYLGIQPAGTALEVLRDAEQADLGLLRDSLNTANALVYRTRRAMYNDDAVMALDYSAGHLSPPLEPTDDDALLVNDVTATRPGGSSARAVDETSPLSALPWPTGVGRYELAYTANVETDAMLPDVASWLMYRGTLDETRFPQVTIDLTVNPSLVTSFDLLRPGDLITIDNLPAYSGDDEARLHVMGWTERVTNHRRLVTLNCRPADVSDVVRLDDTQYGRLDSASTVTSEALDTTETGVDFTGDTWITTASHPAEFPFDIEIGGEVMTVNSATSTTFTVTRSANGVVKSHLTAAPVRLAAPNRLAL